MNSTNFWRMFRRDETTQITQSHMDLAASIQAVAEEVVISLAANAKKIMGIKTLPCRRRCFELCSKRKTAKRKYL